MNTNTVHQMYVTTYVTNSDSRHDDVVSADMSATSSCRGHLALAVPDGSQSERSQSGRRHLGKEGDARGYSSLFPILVFFKYVKLA